MCGIPVHRPSVFSLEFVKCEYENKNRGRFIHRKRKRVGVAKRENGSFLFFSRFSVFALALAGKFKLSSC